MVFTTSWHKETEIETEKAYTKIFSGGFETPVKSLTENKILYALATIFNAVEWPNFLWENLHGKWSTWTYIILLRFNLYKKVCLSSKWLSMKVYFGVL